MMLESGVSFEVIEHHVEPKLLVARGDLFALRRVHVALSAYGFSYWPELGTYATEAWARESWPMVRALTTLEGYQAAVGRCDFAEGMARPGLAEARTSLERYQAQLDANRRPNFHGSFHRTARRGSPMARVVCFARNECGWRYWHRGVRCFGALARTASGGVCAPNDLRACSWCLTGWLARHQSPKGALNVADGLWEAFPSGLKERVLACGEWEELPSRLKTPEDRLLYHPLSLWWEVGGSRWVEKVLRLREGPVA